MGTDLGQQMAAAVHSALGEEAYLDLFATRWGTAPHQMWRCKDGWRVGYTTGRVSHARHEPYNGKFAAFAYRPVGPGSRSGKAKEWKMDYFRSYSRRKAARARAEQLYQQHSK
jgi:hypothetical protein